MAVEKMTQTQQIVIGIAIVVAIVIVGVAVLVITSERGETPTKTPPATPIETKYGTLHFYIRNYTDTSRRFEIRIDGDLKDVVTVGAGYEGGYSTLLSEGYHTISVSTLGKATQSQTVNIPANGHISVSFDFY